MPKMQQQSSPFVNTSLFVPKNATNDQVLGRPYLQTKDFF